MKNFLPNQEFQLDEVLFEHRNQNYGAYVLRHEADKTLTKSMFVGLVFFAAIAAMPFVLNSFKTQKITKPKIIEYNLGDVRVNDVIPPAKQVKPVTPKVATTKYDIPTPTNHPTKETPATSIKDFQHTAIGNQTILGTPPTMSVLQPSNVVSLISTSTVLPKTDDNSAKIHVDIEAKFSTGIDGFRNGMIENFDATDFNGIESTMRTKLTFIVEKNGTISDIKANGENQEFNQEAIKTLKSIKGKWTPAKLNGEFVRSYFSFPISMKFE